MKKVFDYIEANVQVALNELVRLCRQPSISAQDVGMADCAQLVAAMLQEHGIAAEILSGPDSRYPFVYGEIAGQSAKTILFYNHYDVQPPEPLEKWTFPPFEPRIEEGKFYARGVADDKGDLVARLAAVKALRKMRGKLPVTVKFLVEGEEEIVSPSIARFVTEHQDLLKADACIWETGAVAWSGRPIIVLGCKGMVYLTLEAKGAASDVHSMQATSVPNPAWRLLWALSSLKDQDENILVEGFSDDMKGQSPEELNAMMTVVPSPEAVRARDEAEMRELGLSSFLKGLSGFERAARDIFAPTCNIDSLESGYSGTGLKTIVPHVARARIDFRLLPDQRALDILEKVRRHLDRHGFNDVAIVEPILLWDPAHTPLAAPFVEVVRDSARDVYGMEPGVIPWMPASGPIYCFTDLGIPVAGVGVSYLGSRMHAPNEHIRISDFIAGIKHVAAIISRFG
jgi:acetylornithine deacetylase/succinyl-diaminopimelate desuccinylase-like protein